MSERDYRLTPAVVVAFERQFGLGIGKAFAQDRRLEACGATHERAGRGAMDGGCGFMSRHTDSLRFAG